MLEYILNTSVGWGRSKTCISVAFKNTPPQIGSPLLLKNTSKQWIQHSSICTKLENEALVLVEPLIEIFPYLLSGCSLIPDLFHLFLQWIFLPVSGFLAVAFQGFAEFCRDKPWKSEKLKGFPFRRWSFGREISRTGDTNAKLWFLKAISLSLHRV